jgi:hypothetical protein
MPRLATFQVPVVQPAGAGDCPWEESSPALGHQRARREARPDAPRPGYPRQVSVSPQAPRATRLLPRFDPAGLLYGAVVSAATLGVLAHADESTRVAIATFGVLLVYWSAHVYIHSFSKQLKGHDSGHIVQRTRTSAREEIGVLVGGLPAVVVYVVLVVFGVHPPTAGYIALFFVVVLLFTVGYLGAVRAGFTRRVALIEAAGAGSFGIVIVLMKALLH